MYTVFVWSLWSECMVHSCYMRIQTTSTQMISIVILDLTSGMTIPQTSSSWIQMTVTSEQQTLAQSSIVCTLAPHLVAVWIVESVLPPSTTITSRGPRVCEELRPVLQNYTSHASFSLSEAVQIMAPCSANILWNNMIKFDHHDLQPRT